MSRLRESLIDAFPTGDPLNAAVAVNLYGLGPYERGFEDWSEEYFRSIPDFSGAVEGPSKEVLGGLVATAGALGYKAEASGDGPCTVRLSSTFSDWVLYARGRSPQDALCRALLKVVLMRRAYLDYRDDRAKYTCRVCHDTFLGPAEDIGPEPCVCGLMSHPEGPYSRAGLLGLVLSLTFYLVPWALRYAGWWPGYYLLTWSIRAARRALGESGMQSPAMSRVTMPLDEEGE